MYAYSVDVSNNNTISFSSSSNNSNSKNIDNNKVCIIFNTTTKGMYRYICIYIGSFCLYVIDTTRLNENMHEIQIIILIIGISWYISKDI